jgi:orotate phosphoribosyltransferase
MIDRPESPASHPESPTEVAAATTRDERIAALRRVGALLEGHFLLTSGRHSSGYLQAMRLLERPLSCDRVAADVVDSINDSAREAVTLVASPAVGGIVWGQAVARALSIAGGREVRAIFAERIEGVMTLRRGFAIAPGDVVLLAEDVITTGGTVAELGALVAAAGARVGGVAAVADRSGGTRAELSAPCHAWIDLAIPSWTPEHCPLCRAGSSPSKPGSRGLK